MRRRSRRWWRVTGRWVRGVCKRLLNSPHDVDDAFQATFLVLVQKAKTLRDADRLGPWLHGVATRVAMKARARALGRRDRCEADASAFPDPYEGASADWIDLKPILDAEMGRLPAKHRDVLVLCVLEGLTAEEAAEQLSCPVGTVKSRLARGREALRVRLTGRGIAPAVAAAVAAGSARSASASPLPEALIRSTLWTAIGFGTSPSGVASGVLALTRGAAPAMISKSSTIASLLCGGVLLSGLGLASWMKPEAQAQEPQPEPRAAAPGERPDRANSQSRNHLKLMMLAFHNYASAEGHFPPAAIYGSDGQPKLSWRVAILPYLDQNDLYNEFRQDEAWDSPHNKALIARMPAFFTTPSVPAEPGQTRIRGFVGKGAIFDGPGGTKIQDITDGTSNTIALAVADRAVTWTAPGDLPFVEGQPLPGLDESDPRGVLVAFADGSVRYIPRGKDALLKAAITRNGGEVIEWPPNDDAPKPVASGPLPTATATPAIAGGGRLSRMAGAGGMAAGMAGPTSATPSSPPALEQRLQRIEEKLDLLLQRLDASPSESRKAVGNRP